MARADQKAPQGAPHPRPSRRGPTDPSWPLGVRREAGKKKRGPHSGRAACQVAAAPARLGLQVPCGGAAERLDVRRRFFSISRRTPAANAEGRCRSEGASRHVSPETFPTATVRFDRAPRCSPSACTEKLVKIDPAAAQLSGSTFVVIGHTYTGHNYIGHGYAGSSRVATPGRPIKVITT